MNIRSVSNPTIATDLKVSNETKTVKLGESHQDRDADGRRQPDKEPDKSPLTEEELKKAKDYFEALDGLKANGLTITFEDHDLAVRLFIIKDHNGTIVRRIPEHEMRTLITDKDRKSGKIFDRAG